ncbi:uncharacterized protein LOC113306302 [Papaver somniferum]|uniref:uncharacterized protein LOC113306302 n=1 Tax=Papaver somniferum TaxID=3469 RepID=UPI000E6FC428|nr:uncharacterized protein LOC113306302 [Papaver somniferum]
MLCFNKKDDTQCIPSIELPDDLFEESLNPWRFSLIGRLNLRQIKFIDATIILCQQWKLVGNCKLIPLGRGFFTIKMDNEVDRQYIKESKWEVLNQVLQIKKWISNFRPESQKTSKAMVWVRLSGLGLEFWSEKILFKICKEIGTPIKLDEATTKCEVGYYANVLVEIDFANTVPNKIWIGTKYGGFFQSISIPACSKFCSTCKIVGPLITECRVEKNNIQQSSIVQPKNKNNSTTTHIQQQTPRTGSAHIPFDICDRSEVEVHSNNNAKKHGSTSRAAGNQFLEEDSLVSNIVPSINFQPASNSGVVNIYGGEDLVP